MWDTVINVVVCPVIRSFKQSGSRGYKGLRGVKWITRLAGGYKLQKQYGACPPGFCRVHPETGRESWRVKEYKQRRSPPSFPPDIFLLLDNMVNAFTISFTFHKSMCCTWGEDLRRVIKYHLKPKNKSRLSGSSDEDYLWPRYHLLWTNEWFMYTQENLTEISY